MAQPSSPNYPTSLDDDNSLLGLPGNREVFTLETAMSVDDLTVDTIDDISSVDLPCYIAFQGGEIMYCEAISGTDKFMIDSLNDRGTLGTNIQPHGAGEIIYVSILSVNHNLMRTAAVLAQKYHGIVGLDAAKGTPSYAGQAYYATDTDKIYYSFNGSTWVQINFDQHSDLTNLTADDHDTGANAYHIDTRADTWHGLESGVHITGGDDHDHYSSLEGSACVRVDGGLDANKPTGPSQDSEIYFSTDLDSGTLFVGNSGSWEKIGGVPSGGIMAFDSACPSGWTRYAALDDAYPRGGQVTEAGNTGGAWTHTHTYSVIRQHYHGIDEVTGVTSSGGASGNHTIATKVTGSGSSAKFYSSNANLGSTTTSGGDHSHTCTVGGHSTDSAGIASPETDSGNIKPDSFRIMWCQKD